MTDERRFYGDETVTGRHSPAFRYLGRATIAARTDDMAGFDWLLQLRRDCFPGVPELKSNIVLELIEHDAFARKLVLREIGSASILIIDFAEHYRKMFNQMCQVLRLEAPAAPQAIDFLLRGEHRELATQLLRFARESALYSTALPAVDALFRDALKACDLPVGAGDELVDRRVLQEVSEQEFREILVRFSLAFADALDPEQQAAKFLEAVEQRYLPPGYFSLLVLGDAVDIDLTLDVGSPGAYEQVRNAHGLVIGRLATARLARLGRPTAPGRLRQEDSREILGIQAADIAAGIAALEYERHPENRQEGAAALKQIFDKVFFNDDWI